MKRIKPISRDRVRRRQEFSFYLMQGWLAYHDTKRTCSTIAELAEMCTRGDAGAAEREVALMMKAGELVECVEHPGAYELSPAIARKWGLTRHE